MTVSTMEKIGKIELIKGDLIDLDVDAITIYSQPSLELGSGFGTAISVRGGPEIKKELQGHPPVDSGDVFVTSGGKLKAKHLIHAVGPRFSEPETEAKLRKTIVNALRAAESLSLESIALPPLGTGFYAIPLDLCARVMVGTIDEYLSQSSQIERVILCVLDSREYGPFAKALELLQEGRI